MMHIEAAFKALADPTRVRILRLLSKMELSVGELAQVLEQVSLCVSRHVGILCEAGLSERRREGSWVFLHMPRSLHSNCFLHSMSQMLAIAEHKDRLFADQCQADRQKLADIRSSREKLAQATLRGMPVIGTSLEKDTPLIKRLKALSLRPWVLKTLGTYLILVRALGGLLSYWPINQIRLWRLIKV